MGVPYPLGRSFLLLVLTLTAGQELKAAAGDPIVNNDYRLDLTRTVTTGSTRKIGMGGATVGLAEGNAAVPDNPAAAAYRPRAFLRDWEFDMVLGTLVTSNDDTANSGSSGLIYGDQALVDVGLMAQYKQWGLGGVSHATVLASDNLPDDQEAHLLSGTAAFGYSALDHQLALGASVNPVGARLQPKDDRGRNNEVKLRGVGWGLGVLWHPGRRNWRFGAAYTSEVSSREDFVLTGTSPVTVGNLIAPKGVLVSDSLALGAAYEWNQFPLWRSHPAIATFDMRIFGESPNDANGPGAFLSQTEQPGGQKTIITLHTGLEVEAVPRFLRMRLGTYREPSRYDGISARMHITGGFEMRATKFPVWDKRPLAISYAFDSAERYQVHSFSIWLYTFTVPVPDHKETERTNPQ